MSLRTATPLCLPLLLLSTASFSADKSLDRKFDVAPGGKLTVVAGSGDIRVRGTDTSSVIVHIIAKGSESDLERLALTAEKASEGVTVRVEENGKGWRSWLPFVNLDVQVTVDVPRRYDVDLKTSGGDIDVSRLQGRSDAKTSGGNLKIADLQGPVHMKTSGGNIEATNLQGETQLQTSGGGIVVDKVRGNLEVRTSGGGIKVRSIEGTTIAHTSSGNVLAETVRGDVDLETSGGDIKGLGLDGRIRAHTSGGNVLVALTGANRGIEATSSGGDIDVTVPANAKATLDASSSGGSVKTDLPITTAQIGEGRLKGTLNGGGPTIRARTSGGSVHLQTPAE